MSIGEDFALDLRAFRNSIDTTKKGLPRNRRKFSLEEKDVCAYTTCFSNENKGNTWMITVSIVVERK